MTISLFEIFTIGIGPSSSHTVGPIIAARRLLHKLEEEREIGRWARLRVNLDGSLARTGRGFSQIVQLYWGCAELSQRRLIQ
jgi:L-serine dehydratase